MLLAPAAVRPLRVTRSTPIGEDFAHLTYVTQWFADLDALADYEKWEAGKNDKVAIVTEEVVLRGSDWLAWRWTHGYNKWKHVALARRAHGLSQAEFSESWRGHAGKATTKTAGTMPIPAAARGLAYVQNHPLHGIDWPYDAITEVWFEDVLSMQVRVEWFRNNVTTDELFGEITFLTVIEEVLDLV